MENKIVNPELRKAIEEYQCPGCTGDRTCYIRNSVQGSGCGKHVAGTFMGGVGSIFLGLPNGFNRIGVCTKMIPVIFETFDETYYDKFNIPVWKHVDELGNTLVRGLIPRRNEPFIHIYLGNHADKINCENITEEDINQMD